MFWACSKVKSGPHFIEGILGSFLGTLFYPGPHFIEAAAWVVSTWQTRCPSCTIWLNKMSNTFKIFQDHSSKTAFFFFCVCCVFCLDIFGYHTLYFFNIEREHSDLAGIDRDSRQRFLWCEFAGSHPILLPCRARLIAPRYVWLVGNHRRFAYVNHCRSLMGRFLFQIVSNAFNTAWIHVWTFLDDGKPFIFFLVAACCSLRLDF